MNKLSHSILALLLTTGIGAQYALAQSQVGPVVWDMNEPAQINTDDIPNNMSQLIFVRFADNLPATTNANISVDDDYHISLGSNHLSMVKVCQGIHSVSAQSTANKSNNLEFNTQKINTKPSTTYVYRVQTNEQNQTTLTPLTMNAVIDGQPLLSYLNSVPKQSHQISRVTPDCPPAPKPTFVPIPAAVVIAPKPKPKPLPINPKPAPILFDKPIELDVLFEFDSATVVPQYYSRIAEMAQFIKDNDATVSIEGHTDAQGSDSYNLNLSQKRADAVKNLLITQFGINPAKISAQGYGETQPVATNDTKEGRQKNRRVIAIATR